MSQNTLEPEQWVENYSDMMYRYALVRVRDSDAATELVQATFVAALESQDSFAGKSLEKTWLFGILRHKIMDHFRSSKKTISIDWTAEEADPIHFNAYEHMVPKPVNWNMDPAKAAENKELTQIMAKCIEGLPEKFQRVFTLKEVDGLSSKEICKALNITPANLWVILHRAKNRLKLCLESNWFNAK